MRIAHTADVHWRGLSRHDEYRHVFSYFVDDCKKNDVSHIFVGGDIFHTKTAGISPEYIDQLTWWLTTMASVADVHLILGNHDGNLVNLGRQDAITPVVQALNNKRIHLYKKSGVYEFHPGYNWCVFSLFDEEGWKNVKPQPGKINIACYHGSIHGSVTEVGWDIDEGKTVDFFDGYDFAFLGDIHKRQVLATRDGKPHILYPGTPVQQSYAEDIEHGYYLWDIESSSQWNVEFKQLPNQKPFVTIMWSGSIDDLEVKAKNYPGARFRIRSDKHVGQKEISEINALLFGKYTATEVTHKSDVVVDKSIIKAGTSALQRQDLRSPDVLLRLIKENYKGTSVQSDSSWSSVSDVVKGALESSSSFDETARNSKWSLRRLSFDNMFTYGEDNIVNFESLNGIVGIFGANRIGKSSIVGTIMYSLFNTTDRGPMKNLHVCNIRKPHCFSRAVINHNGTDYVIERQTTKNENKKGQLTASTALNLYKIADDEAIELNGEQRVDTEKLIRALIGNVEDFLITSLSAQGEINQFIEQGSAKRRATISRFLDLDIFDRMHDAASKEVNLLKAQLRNFPEKDWDSFIGSAITQLKELEDQTTEIDAMLQERQNEMQYLQSCLLQHGNTSLVTEQQVEHQKKKVLEIEKSSIECSKKIAVLDDEIRELSKKTLTIKQLKSENDIEILRKSRDACNLLETSLVNLRHLLEKEETLLKQQEKSLKILDEVPCGDEFPGCKFIKDAHLNKEKIDGQKNKVQKTNDDLQKAINSLQVIKSSGDIEKLEKLEKLISLEGKIELEISRKETEIAKHKSQCESLHAELESAQDRLKNLEEAYKNEENAEVVSIKDNLKKLSVSIKDLNDSKFKMATKQGVLTSEIDKMKSEKSSRDTLFEKLKVYEIVSSSFSKKGIPLMITKSQLPVINAEIAKVLHGIVDFSVELENDEDSDASEIYINYGDSRRIIELCSGMEKTIASLALRVAMINISSLPKSDIFIIDEGFGTLDDASVEACNRLLLSLKKYFKTIIVITHVDGIKDVVDHVLEITKVEKDAKISFN